MYTGTKSGNPPPPSIKVKRRDDGTMEEEDYQCS